MKLLPASVRGRYALLLVLLVVLGQVSSAILLRQMVLLPRLAQAVDHVARTAQALRAGLLALPPEQRGRYVEAFNARELRDAPPPEPARAGAVLPRLRERMLLTPLEREYVRAVSERLGGDGQVLWRRKDGGWLELRLAVDGVDHWLVLPGLRLVREFSGAWLIATASTALLALLAALWLLGRLHRPLERVERAARSVAAGREPPPLPEEGPREIATVSRSFNQMVNSLRQAERDRAFMLAGVSHDLRTPLTKLRLAVEIAESRLDAELVASMRRSSEEIDAILTQFLDFARDDAADAAEPTDLAALAEEVRAAQADHGRAIGIEKAPVPAVPMARAAMRRVIDNLVENAFRHGRPPVAMRVGCDAQWVWLEILDAGDGIPPGQAEALKQPFRRAEGARSGAAGAGLGLAIVDRIVRRHGGRFELVPGPGGGTCARVRLPR